MAPVMHSLAESGGHRTVYLPQPCSWYPFNLRINPKAYGVPLGERIEGGSTFCVDAHITSNEAVLQNITPMFVREGMSC